MKVPFGRLRFLSLAFALIVTAAPASSATGPGEDRFISHPSSLARDRWIVVLRPEVASNHDLAKEILRGEGRIRHLYRRVLNGFSIELPEAGARALLHDPRVAYIEQAATMTASGTQQSPGWALDRIDSRPFLLDQLYGFPGTGHGVSVYVLDSGVVPVQEISARVIAGLDVVSNDHQGPLEDHRDHGTPVATIIGGTRHGVAKAVTLYSVQIAEWRAGWIESLYHTDDTIAGLDWVAMTATRPAVANLCVNDIGQNAPALNDAARGLIKAGIMLVSSAGNGTEGDALAPATYEGLIVGALQSNMDRRVKNTAQGFLVDLFAPGSLVPVTNAQRQDAYFYNTSAAAPFVTGLVALYLERYPAASPAEIHQWVVNTATTGLVSNITSITPNRVIYIPASIP